MTKVTQQFQFKMPITKIGRSSELVGHLTVVYTGTEDKAQEDGEQYDYDIDGIFWDGINLLALIVSEDFSEVLKKVEYAICNNIRSSFDDYHEGKANDLAEMQFELNRI